MLCEKYKPELIEAAITGADLPPAVGAHVRSCASCDAALTQQRSLITAIDTNLHSQMNAPVPAAMLRRLEAHLAQQRHPKRTPRLSQIFAGAFATIAVAALILSFLSHWRIEPLRPSATNVTPVHNSNAGQIQVHIGASLPSTATPSIRPPTPTDTSSRVVLTSTPASKHSQPEVLVSPDQELLLAAYAQRLRKQKVVLQASTHDLAGIEPSGIAINEIHSLEIKPLPDLNTN